MSWMAAFLEMPGSTCPDVVALNLLNYFLSSLHMRFALNADNIVLYLSYSILYLLSSVDAMFVIDILIFNITKFNIIYML